jgi:simple sugar transport system permease protein
VTPGPAHEEIVLPEVTVVDRKAAVMFGVLTIGLALMVLLAPQEGDTSFRLKAPNDFIELPTITVPSTPTAWVLILACALCTAAAVVLYTQKKKTPIWLVIVFALAWMTGFLTWAAAGGTVPVVGLLGGSLAVAVPLVFGALGGVLGERAGVVNIAIDGQLLFGAFAAAMVGSLAGTWAGLGASMVAGLLVASVLGLFAIRYFVDQVIVGVVLNVLVIGLTSFMFSQVLAPNAASLNSPPRFRAVPIPVLGDIPLIGPIFFRQTVIVYILYITVALVTWSLYRTKWGLRVRAVGEHPKAADTVGIKVLAVRYRNVILGGAVAGLGGAYFTIGSVGGFAKNITSGNGFIALAALIFGRWSPIGAVGASLLFGFCYALQTMLSITVPLIPSNFLAMLPYLATILAVAGLVGKVRAPAADGEPYVK